VQRIQRTIPLAFLAIAVLAGCEDRSIGSKEPQPQGTVAFRLSESQLSLLDPETDSVKLSATRVGFRLRSAAGPVGQMLSLSDLEPGEWNLQAMVYDTGARPLWRGDTTVRIVSSATARTAIRLVPVNGSAVVDPVFDSTFNRMAWATSFHAENIVGDGPSAELHWWRVDMDSNGLVTTYDYSVPSFETIYDTFQLSPERLDSVRRYLARPQIVTGGGSPTGCSLHPNFNGWSASIGYAGRGSVSVSIPANVYCTESVPGAGEVLIARWFIGTRNPTNPLDLGGL